MHWHAALFMDHDQLSGWNNPVIRKLWGKGHVTTSMHPTSKSLRYLLKYLWAEKSTTQITSKSIFRMSLDPGIGLERARICGMNYGKTVSKYPERWDRSPSLSKSQHTGLFTADQHKIYMRLVREHEHNGLISVNKYDYALDDISRRHFALGCRANSGVWPSRVDEETIALYASSDRRWIHPSDLKWIRTLGLNDAKATTGLRPDTSRPSVEAKAP